MLAHALRLELNGEPIRVDRGRARHGHTEEFTLNRLGGDRDAAERVYEGVENPLTATDVADVIAYALNAPGHVNLDLDHDAPRRAVGAAPARPRTAARARRLRLTPPHHAQTDDDAGGSRWRTRQQWTRRSSASGSRGSSSARRRAISPGRSSRDGFDPRWSSRSPAAVCCPAGAIAYALGVKNCGALNVEFYTGIGTVLDAPEVLPPALDIAYLDGPSRAAGRRRRRQRAHARSRRRSCCATAAPTCARSRSTRSPARSRRRTTRGVRPTLWIDFPWSWQGTGHPGRLGGRRGSLSGGDVAGRARRGGTDRRRLGAARSSPWRPTSPRSANGCGPRSRRAAATCRPATACCAPSSARSRDVKVLIVGQDPYPTPGHPIGLSFAVEQHVRPAAAEPLEHLPGARTPISASRPPRTATCRRGATRASCC